MDAVTIPAGAPLTTAGTKAIAAATVGNLLEIYDFIAYGMFAVPISRAFFPAGNGDTALILTFVTFGVGFLARPLGAFLIGAHADHHGRKSALSMTILMMVSGTAVIAFCPTYASMGVAAPIVVTLGRILQGFSAGGEVGGALATLIENAPPGRRGFYSALQQMSQGCSVLAAGLIGVMMTRLFSPAEIMGGYWRLAFVIGLLIVPIGFYIRISVDETPEFVAIGRQAHESKILRLVIANFPHIILGICITLLWTVATYVSNYFTTYAVREIHLSLEQSYLGQIAYGMTMLIICPVAGRLSDALGRRRCLILGAVGMGAVAYPGFWLLVHDPGLASLCVAQIAIAIFLALYASTASAALGELFPTTVRATGVSLSYSLGVTIFGGFTPVLVTALLGYTGDKLSVAYYLIAAVLVSVVPILAMKRPSMG